MDNGVDDEGDGVTDDDGNNGDGATDDDINEDGDGDSGTDYDGHGDGATDDNVDDDDDGDSDGATADDDNIDNDNDDVYDNNLPPRVGKRNDGCDESKREEEETVADSVVVHTTNKQITGRGGGRWRRL